MNAFSVAAYQAAGCTLFPKDAMLLGIIHGETGGKMCDTGCADFKRGKCGAYQKLVSGASASTLAVSSETVKQEAARLGLSLSEVRRHRNPVTQ